MNKSIVNTRIWKLLYLPLIVLMLIGVLPVSAQQIEGSGISIYVSTEGNDDGTGEIRDPLRTLDGARIKVRKLKEKHPSTPVNVFFRGGIYYMTEPVRFDPADSGSEHAPVTYTVFNGEKVTFRGGKKIQLDWKVHKNGIFKADVPDGMIFESLFVDDEMQVLARYPNYDPSIRIFNGTAADCIDPSRVKKWKDPTDGYFHVIHKALWGGFHYRITGKDRKGELTIEGGWQNNRPENGKHDKLRYVENIFEELDVEREWYLDRKRSVLYYKPAPAVDLEKAEIEVAYLEKFIELKGTETTPVKYLHFDGLEFERSIRTFMKTKDRLLRSDWAMYRGAAFLFEGTEHCQLTNARFYQIGGNAVLFNGYNRYGALKGSHLYEIGANPVSFVGDTSAVRNPKFVPYGRPVSDEELDLQRGPKNEKYPSNCLVEDNLIHSFGKVEKQVAGVQISMAAFIHVKNNSIYDCPRAGINVSEGAWGGHLIEYNDVFNTVLETSDHGSFNSWGRDRFWMAGNKPTEERVEQNRNTILLDMLAPNVLRNNRMSCEHGWDIDLDDGSSNYHLYNNLCLTNGIKLREGYNRRVENNICLNNSLHPHVWLKNNQDIVRGNIFGTAMFPIRVEHWGREVDGNWYMDPAGLLSMQDLGLDKNGASGDPLFVDPEAGNFNLQIDSKVFDLGWKDFDMNHFGVQKPSLKAIAKQPEMPQLKEYRSETSSGLEFFGGLLKNLETEAEKSATGMHDTVGVLVVKAPLFGNVVDFQLENGDVLLSIDQKQINNIQEIEKLLSAFEQNKIKQIQVWRNQRMVDLR